MPKLPFLKHDVETTFHLQEDWRQQQKQMLSSTVLLSHEQNMKEISIDGIDSHLY